MQKRAFSFWFYFHVPNIHKNIYIQTLIAYLHIVQQMTKDYSLKMNKREN